jgi:hypothetical protein
MKQWIINWLLRDVIKVAIPEDVIRKAKGVMYLGENPITETELNSLKAEAKALVKMRVWSIINQSIIELAYEKGWRDSTTMEHLNTAKTQFNVLKTQESILNTILNS